MSQITKTLNLKTKKWNLPIQGKKKKKTKQPSEEHNKNKREEKTNEEKETEEEEKNEEEEQIVSHELLAKLLDEISEIEKKIIAKKQINLESLIPIKDKIRAFASLIDQESNMKEWYKEKYLTKTAKIKEQKLEIKNLETENKSYAQITAEKREKTKEKKTEMKSNPTILLRRKENVLVADIENELAKI